MIAVVVVLVTVPGPAVNTTALTPVVTAPMPARTPRARAPPPTAKSHRAGPGRRPLALPDSPSPLSTNCKPTAGFTTEMLDPNDRPDYEENEGATTLRDREFS